MDERRAEDVVSAEPVKINDRIHDVAEYILGHDLPVPVVDDRGETVGMLHRDTVLRILFRDTPSE